MNPRLRLPLALLWALLILYLTTIPNFRPASSSLLSLFLSEAGHFIFFGIQAIFLRPLTRYHFWLTVLYGLCIEFIQRGIPGRSASLFDLLLDALGAWVFLAVVRKYRQ